MTRLQSGKGALSKETKKGSHSLSIKNRDLWGFSKIVVRKPHLAWNRIELAPFLPTLLIFDRKWPQWITPDYHRHHKCYKAMKVQHWLYNGAWSMVTVQRTRIPRFFRPRLLERGMSDLFSISYLRKTSHSQAGSTMFPSKRYSARGKGKLSLSVHFFACSEVDWV